MHMHILILYYINFVFHFAQQQDLNELAAIVRRELPKLARAVLGALITIDVHARDMVSEMVKKEVTSVTNFEWQKQSRWVYHDEIYFGSIIVHMFINLSTTIMLES